MNRRGLLVLFAFVAWSGHAEDTPALQRIREVLAGGAPPVRIVCFGDSVTGLYYHSGGRQAYPELIGRHHPGATVMNAGKSGHTTTNGLARIQQDVLVHKPHLVTVMFGLNDVAKSTIELYRKNLVEIVTKCRAAGAEVVLCTPNAVLETPERPVAQVAAFAEVARGVARELRVPLADTHAALEALRVGDPESWRLSMSDEIHPNLRGHRRIAESILAVIGGAAVTLSDAEPVPDPLRFTLTKVRKGLPLKVLAMPALESIARDVIPGAVVTPWPIEGLDRYTLMKDAAHRVRPATPDLVLIAIPRSAKAKDTEEFIRTQMWIASNSLSRAGREWDVVVVHPDVFEESEDEEANDRRVREIVPAQDLPLIDRAPGDGREAAMIVRSWIEKNLRH